MWYSSNSIIDSSVFNSVFCQTSQIVPFHLSDHPLKIFLRETRALLSQCLLCKREGKRHNNLKKTFASIFIKQQNLSSFSLWNSKLSRKQITCQMQGCNLRQRTRDSEGRGNKAGERGKRADGKVITRHKL